MKLKKHETGFVIKYYAKGLKKQTKISSSLLKTISFYMDF